MKHVEKFIRHLQSSIEKRKAAIRLETDCLDCFKNAATYYYESEKYVEVYKGYAEQIRSSKGILKELHTIQKTETEMLKWLENIRSCHEEMICTMYGDEDCVNIIDFSLEEEQHD